jgi:tRNA-splicing ligase RtcB
MTALKTGVKAGDLPTSLNRLRSEIEAAVPVGNGAGGSHDCVPKGAKAAMDMIYPDMLKALEGTPIKADNASQQMGTLGGGNHFIEVCLDETDTVWLMLHSGSRGIGNKIGTYFIAKAKEDMRRWCINLPDADLAYIPEGSEYFEDYTRAVRWAQEYAAQNRRVMMEAVSAAFRRIVPLEWRPKEFVSCHHNYIARENHFGTNVWVTRKGAVSAREGEAGIIPGAMGRKSFIVEGKGRMDSFTSCSHGAGRSMSRSEAKRRFTVEDHERETAGVECRKDADVIDETPLAYKDIDAVMKAQEDLVSIKHTLRAVLCVKG